MNLRVNVASGNALVTTTDYTLPGVSGPLSVGAAYNSLFAGSDVLRYSGVHGPGWKSRSGVDDSLFIADDGRVLFNGPDGVTGVFKPTSSTQFSSPKEFKAALVKTDGGYRLTWHQSGNRLYFDGDGVLHKSTDRNGNATTFAYDSGGGPTKITSTKGTSGARSATVITHDVNGLITSQRQESGDSSRQVTYGYDDQLRLTRITDAQNRVTRFTYTGDDLTEITSSGGTSTELTYDEHHRVTAIAQHPSSGTTDVTRLAYPNSGHSLVADANTDQSRPVTEVPHTSYVANDAMRVTKATDPSGNTRKVSYTPFRDVASTTGASTGTTTNSYGANSGESRTKTTSPTGASASVAYGNENTSDNPTGAWQPSGFTDTQGHQTLYTYGGPGNLTAAKNAAAAEAKVTYNDDGTVKTSTDPKNDSNSTAYGYDADKQLTTLTPVTGSSLKTRRFTWDAFGRPASSTDGAGHTTSYRYNLDDEITKITAGDRSVSYAYDAAGRRTSRTTAKGDTTIDVTRWTYDDTGRTTGRTSSAGGGALGYAYEAVGNLTSVTDKHGTVEYTYNNRNRLTSMTSPGGMHTVFAYDKDGNRTSASFGVNGGDTSDYAARTKWSYDDSGRISRIVTTRDSGTSVSDVSYCYAEYADGGCSTAKADDTGLRQWSKDNKSGTVSRYSYGKSNRLTKATNVNGHDYSYAYDANGNRTGTTVDGKQTQNYEFNPANQISGNGASYNGAGLQTSSPQGLKMSYNALGQMTGTEKNGTSTAYTYAGATNTELLTSGSRTYTWGLNDAYGKPWLQSFTSGDQSGYINHDGYGTPISLQINGRHYYYATDGLGSVTHLIAGDGSLAATYTYDPYGRVNAKSGGSTTAARTAAKTATKANPVLDTMGMASAPAPGQAGPLVGVGFSQPHGYTAGIWDAGTRQVKLGRRYYNPADGRFTQQDPITKLANPADGNLYAYAADNPINNIDPTGRLSSACVANSFGLVASSVGFVTSTAALFTGVLSVGAVVGYEASAVGFGVSVGGVAQSC